MNTLDAQAFYDAQREAAMAKFFGICLRAPRLHEDKEWLAPRRANGAKVYTRRDRVRLSLILRAKSLGSSLAEIKRYLDLFSDHGECQNQQAKFIIALGKSTP